VKRCEAHSLRGTLLRWLLPPAVIVLALNAIVTYREGVATANTAYDRSLLLSARTIAEGIRMTEGRLFVDLPYAAIDSTEDGLGARVFYRITGPDGRHLAGYDDFPAVPPQVRPSSAYPVLVRFYDGSYRGLPLRVAALDQPVSGEQRSVMALVQVAETLEARELLTKRLLLQTVVEQLLLLALAVGLILVTVKRGLASLDRLRSNAELRTVHDLTPFEESTVPGEARAFVRALNRYIARLAELITLRKRFIESAAHQLRTPIAVLKTQIALAQRERDLGSIREIVDAMSVTTDSAARLANQLLSLTRAEHGLAGQREAVDLGGLCRQVCLELSARAVAQDVDLGFEGPPHGSCTLDGDAVQLQEMLVNLLDNALKYAGAGERVVVRVRGEARRCVLEVDDSGPGIPETERTNVLRRFYRVPGQAVPGCGLGLAIVDETARQHGGTVALDDSPCGGLRVRLRFPMRFPAGAESA
jgi:two-component system sensor histidine kinase TctE